MPAKSFVRRAAGRFLDVFGVVISAGAANAGDIPALDDNGRLDTSVMPTGFGADEKPAAATEAITAPALVNLYVSGGVLSARNADNTAEGKEANGFAQASLASGATGPIKLSGTITGLSGLTIGARYYLGTVGGLTVTPVADRSGKVDQYVGKAISATELSFRAHDYVLRSAA